jgi:hypothetical protein
VWIAVSNNILVHRQCLIGDKEGLNVAKNQRSARKTKKTSYIQKRKNKRSLAKYPALDPSLNLKSRTDLLDYDYLTKLSDDELKWLNKFTEEYVNASFDTARPRNNLHRTKAGRKDCYDRNNSRNRDVLTRQKAQNKTVYLEDVPNKGKDEQDRLNARIELKKMGVLDDEGFVKRKKRSIF